MKQRSKSGIALVSSLLVTMVIMAMAVGMLFLMQGSLANSKNATAATAARNNATSGIEIALMMLQEHLALRGELPEQLFEPSVEANSSALQSLRFSIDSYEVATSHDVQEFHLVVKGLGPAEADVYITEVVGHVLFSHGSSDSSSPAGFYKGIYAGSHFLSTGRTTLINAGLHANNSISSSKGVTFSDCLTRAENGACDSPSRISDTNIPITALAAASCNHGAKSDRDAVFCDDDGSNKHMKSEHAIGGDPAIDPATGQNLYPVEPRNIRNALLCQVARGASCEEDQWHYYSSFQSVRNLFASVNLPDPCSGTNRPCYTVKKGSYSFGDAVGFEKLFGNKRPPKGSIIYIAPGAELGIWGPSSWEGYTIINDGTINFSTGGGSLRDATLISSTPITLRGAWDFTNTTILSDKAIIPAANVTALLNNTTIVSTANSVRFTANMVATDSRIYGEELTFSTPVSLHGETTLVSNSSLNMSTGVSDSGDGVSRAALIAKGNVTLNTSVAAYLNILAGGDVILTDLSTIRGGIVAHGAVKFSVAVTVDSGVEIRNPFLPGPSATTQSGQLVVDSRR